MTELESEPRETPVQLRERLKSVRFYDLSGQQISHDEWAAMCVEGLPHVGDNLIEGVHVSTVLMGIDHDFLGESSRPVIFETMIFCTDTPLEGSDLDHYQVRYCTREQAARGHEIACALVRGALKK